MACTDTTFPYGSLKHCMGKRVLPGIRSKVYYIAKQDIVKWPVLPDTVKTGETTDVLSTYTGLFELASTSKWKYIDVLTKKSPVTADAQGSFPCKTYLNKATFYHPGTEEDATAFAAGAALNEYVYIVQTKTGKYRVIGNEMYETQTNVNQNLGDEDTSDTGTSISVECTDVVPAPFYSGKIDAEDGIINPTV